MISVISWLASARARFMSPDPRYGIFSLQDFGDAPALGISLHEHIKVLAGLLIDGVQIGIQCSVSRSL